MLRITLAALASASFVVTSEKALAAPNSVASKAAQVDAVFKPWDSPSSPGCAVAVTKNGSIAYERGYGMADLDHDVKITATTVFDVGSIAKQFTAAAILMLAQEGKLSLDNPIRKYLGDVPDVVALITLRQMMYHTSGIRDYQQLLAFDGWRLDSPDQVTEGDISYIISRQKELNFPPGTDFLYSNTNYFLLARVVSQVSKMTFPEFTMTRIFQPLEMKQTHFRDDHGEIIKNVAYSYVPGERGFLISIPNDDNVGDTNLFTTVEDLARWEENFQTGRVGGVRVVHELEEAGELNDGTRLIYAPGMFVGAPNGLRIMESGNAGDAGYAANILRFVDDDFSVIALCNVGSSDPLNLSRKIADLYLEGELTAALHTQAGDVRSYHPDAKLLAAYAGTYLAEAEDLVLKLDQRDDALWAESFTGPSAIGPARLDALGKNRFSGVGLKEIDFGTDPHHPELIAKRWGLPDVRYRRASEYRPTPDELRQFTGQYSSRELDVPYYLTLEKGRLAIHPPKMPAHPLEPLATDLFTSDGIRVRFRRDRQKHVSGFLMSGSWNRVQNLRFERAAETGAILPVHPNHEP